MDGCKPAIMTFANVHIRSAWGVLYFFVNSLTHTPITANFLCTLPLHPTYAQNDLISYFNTLVSHHVVSPNNHHHYRSVSSSVICLTGMHTFHVVFIVSIFILSLFWYGVECCVCEFRRPPEVDKIQALQ